MSKILVGILGGVGEIGKNMVSIEHQDEILIIDAGIIFPEEYMLGIDVVIPDISYLRKYRDKIKGIILTHAHEDHIGALPFVLPKIGIKVPIYGTKLTLGIVEERLKESGGLNFSEFRRIQPDNPEKIGNFSVDFFRVNHSIPDGIGIIIYTSLGIIVHSGDFKIDQTPVDNVKIDFSKLSKIGEKDVLLFFSDCLNVEREGYTPSERNVGESFERVFHKIDKRLIIATFASNVHRIQQAINLSFNYDRKVAIAGKNLQNIVKISNDLGYLNIPEDTLVNLTEIDNYPPSKIVILATGTQGEPMSALNKMARDEYKDVKIIPGDTVIISATPIPGNENFVFRTINNLFKKGAKVIYEEEYNMHVSGHASREELKFLLNLIKPKFVIPFHGEYRHLVKYAELAEEVGIDRERVLICESGDLIEIERDKANFSGKIAKEKILIDGLGDVGSEILRDRKILSQDGVFVISFALQEPSFSLLSEIDVITRGFIYQKMVEEIIKEIKEIIKEKIKEYSAEEFKDVSILKKNLQDVISSHLYKMTKRRPLILIFISEIKVKEVEANR